MHKERQKLTTLIFDGPSFEDHGLELDMLSELVQYKKILLETAENLWRQEHPDRQRLPRGFKESLRIKFYEVLEGSAAVPLYREVEYEDGQLHFEYEDELNQAVELVEAGIAAAGEDKPLPESFPKNVLPLFEGLGKNLGEGDKIKTKSPKRDEPVSFTPQVRERLVSLVDKTYEDIVDLIGEVRKADLDGLNFAIRLDNGEKIEGKFEPEHEPQIMEAFSNHNKRRLNVIGLGLFSQRDRSLGKIIKIERISVLPAGKPVFDDQAKPIWELVVEMGARIPMEEWEKVPSDLSKNLDHYLYGSPRTEK